MEIDAVTAAGIPCSLVACFQEYDLDALDPAQHGHLIIERVLAYDDRMAHLIEAGSDMFLMPSRFEPCGLNQMYSLRYGTVPVVRATGGLADTIVDLEQAGGRSPPANGFSFREYNGAALEETLRRACEAYRQTELWHRLIATGMAQDWSWARSAREYVRLYETTLDRVRCGRRA